MNAKILFKAAILCMAMLAGSISFTSCSDDDDPVEEVTNELTKVKVEYSIELSDSWYKYFDIEVSYNIGAEEKTVTITEDQEYIATVPYTGNDVTYYCKVTAKPKAEVPAFDTNITYLFEKDMDAEIHGIMNDGSVSNNFVSVGNESKSKLNVAGATMEAFTKKEHKLYTFSYTPEK